MPTTTTQVEKDVKRKVAPKPDTGPKPEKTEVPEIESPQKKQQTRKPEEILESKIIQQTPPVKIDEKPKK